MDDNNYVAVASLDLSSAFDIVNINLLLTRLATMGLSQDVVGLLQEWLVGRVRYVEVEGSCSELFDVDSGTAQRIYAWASPLQLIHQPIVVKC